MEEDTFVIIISRYKNEEQNYLNATPLTSLSKHNLKRQSSFNNYHNQCSIP